MQKAGFLMIQLQCRVYSLSITNKCSGSLIRLDKVEQVCFARETCYGVEILAVAYIGVVLHQD